MPIAFPVVVASDGVPGLVGAAARFLLWTFVLDHALTASRNQFGYTQMFNI